MKTLLTKSTLSIITVLVALFSTSFIVYAQEECDENGLIRGTYCPCQTDRRLASVCGLVSSADISAGSLPTNPDKVVYSTREPVTGVTVSLYENKKGYPTGKPFGNLERKLVECVTSPTEGKYYCPMRRLNPGNAVYVLFSCGGKVADAAIISSVVNFVGLDSDVGCNGNYTYTPAPTPLALGERDALLGCLSEPERENENAGFEEPELVSQAANIGETGGDIRFTPYDGFGVPWLGIFLFTHPGAYQERDCLIRYRETNDLDREYTIFEPNFAGGVNEKCNLDPDRDNNGVMEDPDERTTPFRYDIPTGDPGDELREDTGRVWETRVDMQRELTDPRSFAQYNHLMFGECVGRIFLRYYKTNSVDSPIPCNLLSSCSESLGDPFRNIHTTMSIGSRLESIPTWMDMIADMERDPEDCVCADEAGECITVAEIQPPYIDDACVPGEAGCRYKLPREYYMPQFFMAAGGVKKTKTNQTIGDAYGRVEARDRIWQRSRTEAINPHLNGHWINSEDASIQKTNSGVSAIRMATTQISTTGGVLVNRFVGRPDAEDEVYEYNSQTTVWQAGGDMRSLCTASSVTDLVGVTGARLLVPDPTIEQLVIVDNEFTGRFDPSFDTNAHTSDKAAGASTYATQWTMDRDRDMSSAYQWRDIFDSLQRFTSGGANQLKFRLSDALQLIRLITNRGPIYKSFADRNPQWQPDTPSYIKTTFCITERTFNSTFPAYGEAGYPGDAGNCYPWENLGKNGHCRSWPGARNAWSPVPELGFSGSWPGLEGNLRTCRIDQCEATWKVRTCPSRICFPVGSDTPTFCQCPLGSEVEILTGPCTDDDRYECLAAQEDTWQRTESEIPDPDFLVGPMFEDVDGDRVTSCDLWKAGPMNIDGDIEKDHATRITQETIFGQSQKTTDPIPESADYTALSMISHVEEPRQKTQKAAFDDYATTNTQDGIQGTGGFGVTHELTAGQLAKGFGTGASVNLIKTISHPERPSMLVEDFPPVHWFCNINQSIIDTDPSSDTVGQELNWCRAIEPPGPIDLASLDGGACNANTSNGSCPISIPPIAERILGAAGAYAGIPASMLLAIIDGEGGWIGPGSRIEWTEENVISWSEPWYGRIPSCNDMVPTAEGPFGLIDRWFNSAVAQGGFHPLRVSPTTGEPVVSKCNFIDAAYAAAWALSSNYTAGCAIDQAQAENAMRIYRGGIAGTVQASARMLEILNNCH